MTANGIKKQIPDWQREPDLIRFLADLENHGNASRAMVATGLGRGRFWRWRKKDKEFEETFLEIRRCGLERLRDHAHDLAMGALDVAEKNRSDATLLRFLIQQTDQSFKPTHKVKVGTDGPKPFIFQMILDDKAVEEIKGEGENTP